MPQWPTLGPPALGPYKVIKILVKTIGCMVWQEVSQDRYSGNSLGCKEQIKEEKLERNRKYLYR